MTVKTVSMDKAKINKLSVIFEMRFKSTRPNSFADAHAIALAQLEERTHPLKWSFSSLEEGKIDDAARWKKPS